MDGFGKAGVVLYDTIVIRHLYYHASHATLSEFLFHVRLVGHTLLRFNPYDVNTVELRIGINHAAHLRVDGVAYQYLRAFLSCGESHHHRLGSSRSPVVHRCVRHIHAGKLRHHTLILEDIVQRTLRNLCLIRCIAGQELRALHDTGNHRRRIMIIYTAAGKACQLIVHHPQGVEELTDFQLAHRISDLVVAFEADILRHIRVESV